jgi:tetratricopeptide (TPR) repeat protein
MEEVLSMSRGFCLPFLLLAVASAVFCQTNANLDLADTYEQLKRWPEAEKYFQEAAKDSDLAVRRQALAGIVRVRTAANSQNQELAGARYYKNAGVLDKAEEQYVAALKSDSQDVKNSANSALEEHSGLWFKRRFDWVLQWIAYLVFVIGVFSMIVLVLNCVN